MHADILHSIYIGAIEVSIATMSKADRSKTEEVYGLCLWFMCVGCSMLSVTKQKA